MVAILLDMLVILFAAWNIRDAIREFREERYFLFGIDSMLVIWSVLVLTKMIFLGGW